MLLLFVSSLLRLLLLLIPAICHSHSCVTKESISFWHLSEYISSRIPDNSEHTKFLLANRDDEFYIYKLFFCFCFCFCDF